MTKIQPTETVETTLSELLKNNHLKVGSFIKLPIGYRKISVSSEKSGHPKEQMISNYEQQSIFAQFYSINNQNNTLLFLGLPTDYKIKSFGIAAYMNSEEIVSDLCKEMFSLPNYGITARSISEDDYDFICRLRMNISGNLKKRRNIFLDVAPKPILKLNEIKSNNFMVGFRYLEISEQDIRKNFEITFYLKKEYSFSYSILPVIEIPRTSDKIFVLEDKKHSGMSERTAFQIIFGEAVK